MMLSRRLSSSLRLLICLPALLLLATESSRVCRAESERSLPQWAELIGLGAMESRPVDIGSLRSQILTLAPPRACFLGRSSGHTKGEYLAGTAAPVQPAEINGPEPGPRQIPSGSFVTSIDFCKTVDARNNAQDVGTTFPWDTKQVFIVYACANPPGDAPILQRTVIHRWPDGQETRYEWPVDMGTGRYREYLMLYHNGQYLEPGLYTVELRVWDRLVACAEARINEPRLDEVEPYLRELDRLRGGLQYLLVSGTEPLSSPAATEMIERLADGYLEAAYRAYLLGPSEKNRLLEARALATAASLRAVLDANIPGGDPSHAAAAGWLRRAEVLTSGIDRGTVLTAMASGALAPEKISAAITELPAPAPSLASRAGEGTRWALLIGVNRYSFGQLRYAVEDARALAQALYDPNVGAFDHVITMTDDSPPEGRPTKANILRVLSAEIRQARPDTLVLYFAGHGAAVRDQASQLASYLLPSDADRSSTARLRETGLSMTDELIPRLTDTGARTTLFIVDACRDEPDLARGGGSTGLSEDLSRGLSLVSLRSLARATVLACGPGEQAWEWSEKGHGVFTYFLIDGLKKGTADPRGLTLRDLVADVSVRVSKWAEENKHARQNPDGAPAPLPDLVLVRPRGSAPITIPGTGNLN